jgi:hypothetical protein
VGVHGAGHITDAGAAASTVVVVAHGTSLDIGGVATRIVHKLALANVEASGVECVIVVASAVVVVQLVVDVAGFAATVEVGAIDVVACWLASDVVVVAVVAMTWLCLHLRLHARVHGCRQLACWNGVGVITQIWNQPNHIWIGARLHT